MPGDHIFQHRVVWSQVVAAAEPPNVRFAGFLGKQETYIGMAGRYVRIARVDDQGHAQGLKTSPAEFGPRRGRGWRQTGAIDMRKIDSGLLEHRTSGQHAAVPAPGGQTRWLRVVGLPLP